MRSTHTLIIGAGPTGLGAAWQASQLGIDWLLVEGSQRVGGAAQTRVDGRGFRWDLGGHVIASHYRTFDDVLTATVKDWSYPSRSAWVLQGNGFIPAPIQQNVMQMPDTPLELLTGREFDGEPNNLDEYHDARFGSHLNELFFRPYNFKMWAHPARLLDFDWTAQRAGSELPNVPELVLSADPIQDRKPFPYPTYGTGRIWSSISDSLEQDRQLMGNRLVQVDLEARIATFADGLQVHYERMVSTAPLTHLCAMAKTPGRSYVAQRMLTESMKLKASSVIVFGVGFRGEVPAALRGMTYAFCADPKVPWHRLTMLSNYSEAMVPKGHWSALMEISYSALRSLPANFLDQCMDSLYDLGADVDDLVTTFDAKLGLGYPLPTLHRDGVLMGLQGDLGQYGVKSRGRFGGWRYESSNQDYSFQQGVDAVLEFQHLVGEDSYWCPEKASFSRKLVQA